MKSLPNFLYYFFIITIASVFSHCTNIKQLDEYYCILQSGEATQTSVVLLARLQKTDTLLNKDIKGINGFVKFRITRDINSKSYLESPFFSSIESNDFVVKYEFNGLRPGQKYYYKINYGPDTSNVTSSPWNSFKTLNLPGSDKNVSFIVANGLEFNAISHEMKSNNLEVSALEANSGIPILKSISTLKPDFWIINQETQSSSLLVDSVISDPTNLTLQWHQLFSLYDLNLLLSGISSYWLIPISNPWQEISAKHLPVTLQSSVPQPFCRTYCINRDIQIWILGNSDFYDDDAEIKMLPWLKKTIKESDTPFKLIIGPSALYGNNSNEKAENSTASEQFLTRRDSLFNWLKNNGLRNNGLYFISSIKDVQYHAMDPSGFEEFSCGKLTLANFSNSLIPIDTTSRFETAKISLPFLQNDAKGAFLMVNSGRDEYNSPVLLFRYFDSNLKLLYAVHKF